MVQADTHDHKHLQDMYLHVHKSARKKTETLVTEENLLFLYNVQHVNVLQSLFISDYNLARKSKWKH